MAAPAAAFLSPVARDYPSRALERFFSPSRSRLFLDTVADAAPLLAAGKAPDFMTRVALLTQQV
jgi:hypothetical protein